MTYRPNLQLGAPLLRLMFCGLLTGRPSNFRLLIYHKSFTPCVASRCTGLPKGWIYCLAQARLTMLTCLHMTGSITHLGPGSGWGSFLLVMLGLMAFRARTGASALAAVPIWVARDAYCRSAHQLGQTQRPCCCHVAINRSQ